VIPDSAVKPSSLGPKQQGRDFIQCAAFCQSVAEGGHCRFSLSNANGINESAFTKGMRVGGSGVSTYHDKDIPIEGLYFLRET
jgi:hypothetical protein